MQNTDEKTELSLDRKYCGRLASNVFILSGDDGAVCLSSHLCEAGNEKNCDHYKEAGLPSNEPRLYK